MTIDEIQVLMNFLDKNKKLYVLTSRGNSFVLLNGWDMNDTTIYGKLDMSGGEIGIWPGDEMKMVFMKHNVVYVGQIDE